MKETLTNLKRVYQFGKKYNKHLVIFTIFTCIGIVFNIITPIISAQQIMYITNNQFEQLFMISIVFFIILFLNTIKSCVIQHNTARYFRGVTKDIKNKMGLEMLKLQLEDIDNNPSGAFIQRLSNDASNLGHVITKGEGYMTSILTKVGIFITIFIINKLVFFYFLLASSILIFIEVIKNKKVNEKEKIQKKSTDVVTTLTAELVRGSRDIKMLNAEHSFMRRFTSAIDDSSDKFYDVRKTDLAFKSVSWTLIDLCILGLIGMLAMLIKMGALETAMAVALFSYRNEVLESILVSINDFLSMLREFNLSCSRVFEIIDDEKYKKEEFGTKTLSRIKGDIEFKDVSFSYKDNKVLDNFNMKIPAGKTIGLVGKSGAGKTTIFNLICKLYDVNEGDILLDGIPLNELDRDSIRGNITIISQNPYIFNMSIKDNMKLVKYNVTNKEIKEACKIACLDDFIESLPDKYDSIIGEGGVNLSGGQRQRLAIARAFIQKTKIILFDEATSALDNETQTEIQKAIENLKGEYTIAIIAHRLSTIVNCDKIYMLENGKIVDSGTHKELLKSSKEYRKLCKTEIVEK